MLSVAAHKSFLLMTTVGLSLVKQSFLLSVPVFWVALPPQIQFSQAIPMLQSQELSHGPVVLFEMLTVRLRNIVGIIRKRSSLSSSCRFVRESLQGSLDGERLPETDVNIKESQAWRWRETKAR